MEVRTCVQHRLVSATAFDAAEDFAMLALQEPQRARPVDRPPDVPRANGLQLTADVLDYGRQPRIAGLRGDRAVQTKLEALPLRGCGWRHELLVQLGKDRADRAHIAVRRPGGTTDGMALQERPQLAAVDHVRDERAREGQDGPGRKRRLARVSGHHPPTYSASNRIERQCAPLRASPRASDTIPYTIGEEEQWSVLIRRSTVMAST